MVDDKEELMNLNVLQYIDINGGYHCLLVKDVRVGHAFNPHLSVRINKLKGSTIKDRARELIDAITKLVVDEI